MIVWEVPVGVAVGVVVGVVVPGVDVAVGVVVGVVVPGVDVAVGVAVGVVVPGVNVAVGVVVGVVVPGVDVAVGVAVGVIVPLEHGALERTKLPVKVVPESAPSEITAVAPVSVPVRLLESVYPTSASVTCLLLSIGTMMSPVVKWAVILVGAVTSCPV